MTRDKKLAGIVKETVLAKSQAGEGLTLAEAAVRYGMGYATMQRLKQQGMPLVGGKLFDADFCAWRRRAAVTPEAAASGSTNGSAARRKGAGAGKSGECLWRHD